jgi:hypothetical protein
VDRRDCQVPIKRNTVHAVLMPHLRGIPRGVSDLEMSQAARRSSKQVNRYYLHGLGMVEYILL